MISERIQTALVDLDNQILRVRARADAEVAILEKRKATLSEALTNITPTIERVVAALETMGFLTTGRS